MFFVGSQNAMAESDRFDADAAFADIMSAIQDLKDDQLTMLRAARGMYWACANCPAEEKQEARRKLELLLDLRDQFILVTHVAGVRPGPLDNEAKKLIYGSPYGEIPLDCRAHFDRWAECISGLGGAQCMVLYDNYRDCRDKVELIDNLPSFEPDSAPGILALRANPGLRYEQVADFDVLYRAAMKLDNLVYSRGLGVSHAAAVAAVKAARRGGFAFIDKFAQKTRSDFCSKRFRGQRIYESYLGKIYLNEYGSFDRDEAEQWLGKVLAANNNRDVEKYLRMTYRVESVGRPRRGLLNFLTGEHNKNDPAVKALWASLKSAQDIIRRARPNVQAAFSCIPDTDSAAALVDDPLYRQVITIWQEDDLTATPEQVMQWIDLYNSMFGKDTVYKALQELVSAYDNSDKRPWMIHMYLVYRKLQPIVARASAPDVTGEYVATGTDPQGNPYKIRVKIDAQKPGMYWVRWQRGQMRYKQGGALFYNGKLVFGRTGTPQSYTWQADGRLVGEREWFDGSRASDRVRETLVRDSTVAPVMRGYYRVEGVGPNGVAYRGVCFVPYMGDTSSTNPFCRLRHHLGVTLTNGFGQRKGDEFRYDWKAMGVTGVMNLQLELDGSLHGRGDNGEQSNWTPVTEAQGIPTDLDELVGHYSLLGRFSGRQHEGDCDLRKEGDRYYFRRHIPGSRFRMVSVIEGVPAIDGKLLAITLTLKNGSTAILNYQMDPLGKLVFESSDKTQWESCSPATPWPGGSAEQSHSENAVTQAAPAQPPVRKAIRMSRKTPVNAAGYPLKGLALLANKPGQARARLKMRGCHMSRATRVP